MSAIVKVVLLHVRFLLSFSMHIRILQDSAFGSYKALAQSVSCRDVPHDVPHDGPPNVSTGGSFYFRQILLCVLAVLLLPLHNPSTQENRGGGGLLNF